MTEIPDYLLRRAQRARNKTLGIEDQEPTQKEVEAVVKKAQQSNSKDPLLDREIGDFLDPIEAWVESGKNPFQRFCRWFTVAIFIVVAVITVFLLFALFASVVSLIPWQIFVSILALCLVALIAYSFF